MPTGRSRGNVSLPMWANFTPPALCFLKRLKGSDFKRVVE
jgi:hypothetical protein